jgi:hypothetical protein
VYDKLTEFLTMLSLDDKKGTEYYMLVRNAAEKGDVEHLKSFLKQYIREGLIDVIIQGIKEKSSDPVDNAVKKDQHGPIGAAFTGHSKIWAGGVWFDRH